MKQQNTYDTQTYTQEKTNGNTSTQWLRDNFWNLLITFALVVGTFTVVRVQGEANARDIEDLKDSKSALEIKLDNLPDKETLRLELAPIKTDLQEVKTDLKKHLQE